MRNLDFTSWNALLTTLLGIVVVSLVAVGIRLAFMQVVQRRRERENQGPASAAGPCRTVPAGVQGQEERRRACRCETER